MIQHLCDRCKQVIDPKTGLIHQRPTVKQNPQTREFVPELVTPSNEKTYNDGVNSWKFSVIVKPANGSDLCRDCVVNVILGRPYVAPVSDPDA